MIPIIKTRDEIFDDLINEQYYQLVPRDTVFLHNSITTTKYPNKKDNLQTTEKKLYLSPFRSNINELFLDNSNRLKNLKYPTTNPNSIYNKNPVIGRDQLHLEKATKDLINKDKESRGKEEKNKGLVKKGNQKKTHRLNKKSIEYAHDIDFPQELINIQNMQNEILVDLDQKEKILKKWKKSQKIIEIENEPTNEIDIIKEKIDIHSVPKVPTYLYEANKLNDNNQKIIKKKLSVFKIKNNDKITKNKPSEINTLKNPLATKKNPEMIVKFNDKLYSKEIFDNVQFDKFNHNLLMQGKKTENEAKLNENEKNWGNQLNKVLEKIDKLKIDINNLNISLVNTKEVNENENISNYFTKMANFNKEKIGIIKDIQNLNDFEYEWEHSKATNGKNNLINNFNTNKSKNPANQKQTISSATKNTSKISRKLGEDNLFEYTMEEETRYV